MCGLVYVVSISCDIVVAGNCSLCEKLFVDD